MGRLNATDQAIRAENIWSALRSMEWTYAEIAEHYGVSETAVFRIAEKHGHRRKKPQKRLADYNQQIEAMLNDGVSYLEIERTLGISAPHLGRKYPKRGWGIAERDAHSKVLRQARIHDGTYTAPHFGTLWSKGT